MPLARLTALLAAMSASLPLTLAAAPAAAADDVNIGCVAHARYDGLFRPDAAIPHVATRSWFTPQGLTWWPKHNWLIVSYYYPHADPDVPGGPRDAKLAVIDRGSGKVVKNVRLSGMTGHAGGIAVGGGYLWVASERSVHRYGLGRLQRAARGGGIAAGRRFDLGFSAGYLTFAGGALWVGNFVETGTGGVMRKYAIAKGGNLLTAEPLVSVGTPARVQGVVVRPRAFVFSTSFGRGNASRLITTTRAGAVRALTYAPAMSEGATLVGGDFLVVYESGARTYLRPSAGGTRPCSPPTLRIHRTAVSNLIAG